MASPSLAERSVAALAGLLLIATAFVPWVRAGNGSTMHGFDLADTLRTSPLVPWWGPLAGAGIYACVLIGCVVVALCASGHRICSVAQGALGAVVLLATATLAVTHRFPASKWDLGPVFCATAGAALVPSSLLISVRSRR
jgi:hypothetical protein